MGEFGFGSYLSFEFSGTIFLLAIISALVVYVSFLIIYPGLSASVFDNGEDDEMHLKVVFIVIASTLEEVWYRWILFFLMVPIVKFADWATFGLSGWIYQVVLIPIADFTSFGFLSPQLSEGPWIVGAAMIAANVFFRDGHKYQGLHGIVKAWFAGLFFFYAMFNFGLGMAIIAHVTFNLTIAVVNEVRNFLGGRPSWAR